MNTLPQELLSKIYTDPNLSFDDLIQNSLVNKINEKIIADVFYDYMNTLYTYNKWIFDQFYDSKDDTLLDLYILIEYFSNEPMRIFRFEDIYDFIKLYEEYFYKQIKYGFDNEINFKGSIGKYIYFHNYKCEIWQNNDRHTFILTHKDYFHEDNDNIYESIINNLHCDLKDKNGLTLHAMIVHNTENNDEVYWFKNRVLHNTDTKDGILLPAHISCKLEYKYHGPEDIWVKPFYTFIYYKIHTIYNSVYYNNGVIVDIAV
jgi:hypothetical protein